MELFTIPDIIGNYPDKTEPKLRNKWRYSKKLLTEKYRLIGYRKCEGKNRPVGVYTKSNRRYLFNRFY